MNDLRQSRAYRLFQQKEGWHHRKIGRYHLAYRNLPLWPWPVAKIQRLPFPNLKEIDQAAQQLKISSLSLEPLALTTAQRQLLVLHGYHLLKQAYLPSRTVLLSLRPSLAEIQSRFKKDTRYCLRKAASGKLNFSAGTDQNSVAAFHQAWKKTTGLKLLIPSQSSLEHLRLAFEKNLVFQFISFGQKIVAGNLILIADKTAFYYYAFTNREGRRYLSQYLLVWEAIVWAKKRGCLRFDFEGVSNYGAGQKAWDGFSHFKKSFGGQEVVYPSAWGKIYRPKLKLFKTGKQKNTATPTPTLRK